MPSKELELVNKACKVILDNCCVRNAWCALVADVGSSEIHALKRCQIGKMLLYLGSVGNRDFKISVRVADLAPRVSIYKIVITIRLVIFQYILNCFGISLLQLRE